MKMTSASVSRIYIFIFLTLGVCSSVGFCDEESAYYPYDPVEYPNLIKTPKSCSGTARNPPTSICDPQNILSRQEAKVIDNLIDQNANTTTCLCGSCKTKDKGLKIRVAIVEIFKQRSNLTLSESLANFAEYIRSAWDVSPTCMNDVIIFVSTVYSKVYISCGLKAQRVLTPSIIKQLVDDNLSCLRHKHLSECLQYIVESINEHTRSYNPSLDRLGLYSGITILIICGVAVLIGLVGLVYLFNRRDNRRRLKQRQARAQNYDKMEKNAETKEESLLSSED